MDYIKKYKGNQPPHNLTSKDNTNIIFNTP